MLCADHIINFQPHADNQQDDISFNPKHVNHGGLHSEIDRSVQDISTYMDEYEFA